MYLKDPLKATAKKRYLCGLREVLRALKTNKAKAIIVVHNVERIEAEDGEQRATSDTVGRARCLLPRWMAARCLTIAHRVLAMYRLSTLWPRQAWTMWWRNSCSSRDRGRSGSTTTTRRSAHPTRPDPAPLPRTFTLTPHRCHVLLPCTFCHVPLPGLDAATSAEGGAGSHHLRVHTEAARQGEIGACMHMHSSAARHLPSRPRVVRWMHR